MNIKFFDRLKNNLANLIILSIILIGIWIRVYSYGSLFLSVGMMDTSTYISSSESTTSFNNAFTNRRLITSNLLYKLIENDPSCKTIAISNPAWGEEGIREIHPCFNRIVLLQNILSIFGWCLLAWTVAKHIKSTPYKIIATVLILTFGFTPQIAEWDSILSSESLSVSLLPIILALLLDIVFLITAKRENSSNLKINILVSLWLLVFILWLFVRDVHIYAILTTVILTAPFLLIKKYRQIKVLAVVVVLLIGLFILGNTTSKASSRWQVSLTHVLDYYIFPYPARVDFFVEHGMPAAIESNEYKTWFDAGKGINTYALFLISHPGFVITSALDISPYFKTDFIQPHFKSPENQYRDMLLIIGEVAHPETYAVYIIDLIVFFSLCATTYKLRDKRTFAWTWLATWVFIYSSISLFISLFGDIDGTRRHIFPSVELFRLFLWIFLIVQMDLAAENKREEATLE